MKTVLLVHGAWHGAWCWHKVVAGLEDRGVPVLAVDLPLAGLAADAEAVRAEVATLDGEIVACGHSYGGFVISRLTSPDFAPTPVTDLVFLCATMTPEGTDVGSMLASAGSLLLQAYRVTEAGAVIDDEFIAPSLYADCTDDDIALAKRSLRPMPANDPAPPPVRPGYAQLPSTYVICTQDRAMPVAVQRQFAANATSTVEWDVSHSPFFSAPDRIVELLTDIASR